jgi:hypothetical protein
MIYESPGTVLFLVHLAFAVISAATRAVQQTFVACRQGTNARSLPQDASTTLGANLSKTAWTILHTYKKGIECGDDWLVNIRAQFMHSQSTGHDQNAVGILDSSIILFKSYLSHFVASGGNNNPASDQLAQLL